MVGAEGELVGERVSAWHFCCWMHTDGQKAGEREKSLRPCTGSRELGFPAKNSLQGWGRYVAVAVGLVTARDGESWRREEQGEGRKEEKKEVHL